MNSGSSGHTDPHSYSNPEETRVRHIDLDLTVNFSQRRIEGTAGLLLDEGASDTLIVDTRGLRIDAVEAPGGAAYELGEEDPILGAPLRIRFAGNPGSVTIRYATSPEASALQWLEPAQTAGKLHPFLYTQSQAIHARSWIPLQDSPAVRVTYSARMRTPQPLTAVMSAQARPSPEGSLFHMPWAVPSYLIALAVGDLSFQSLGQRTGVYAEGSVVDKAAYEFADTESMIAAVEALYGPYRWGRYDLLVLPPSFPFGGMENPRLTFVTPTMIAGDRSLVALVAHELAHSWSGNLVTNATWEDFWLNEGFTVYLERRIMEQVYGPDRARMEACLGRRDLEREIARLSPCDTILHVDLRGRDPDDGCTLVPYEKGALFLGSLEDAFGREIFDAFLREYFDHFAFQSITTEQFLRYLRSQLPVEQFPLDQWLEQSGVPASAPQLSSPILERVEDQASRWLDGRCGLADLDAPRWTTQEWLHFLHSLPSPLPPARMRELDDRFHLTGSGNAEILHLWLLLAIRSSYAPALARLEEFLRIVGRRKFLRPLYQELVRTPSGLVRAREIYGRARPGYHPISRALVEEILNSTSGQC